MTSDISQPESMKVIPPPVPLLLPVIFSNRSKKFGIVFYGEEKTHPFGLVDMA